MAQDVQILPGEALASAKGWVIPDALTIMPKAISATFDGSGASATFHPTVEIISDSGHLVARVPTDTAVVAGDTAEVTFAPFLRSKGASAAGASPGAFIPYADGALPAGDTYLPILFILESVPGVFTQTGAGPNPFSINTFGTYLFQFSVSVTNPNATDETIQFVFDTANAPNFLTAVPIVLSFVAPANGKPVTALYNGSIPGVAYDPTTNECDLKVHCSNPLNVFSPFLVVSQLSTGLI